MTISLQKPHDLNTEALKFIVKGLVQTAGVHVKGPVMYDPLAGGLIFDCGKDGPTTYTKIKEWADESPTTPWVVTYDKDTSEVRLTLSYAKKWWRVLRPAFPPRYITDMFAHEYADIAFHREQHLNDKLNRTADTAEALFEAKLHRTFRKRQNLRIKKDEIESPTPEKRYTLIFIRPKKGGGSLENWVDGIMLRLATCARVFYDQLDPLKIPGTRFPQVTVYDWVTREVLEDGREQYTFVVTHDRMAPTMFRKHWEASCIKHEDTLAIAMDKYTECCNEWEDDRKRHNAFPDAIRHLWSKCPVENVRFARPISDGDQTNTSFIAHLRTLTSDTLGAGYTARIDALGNTPSGFSVDLFKSGESKIKPDVAVSRVRDTLNKVDRWALNNCEEMFSFPVSDLVNIRAMPSFIVSYVE